MREFLNRVVCTTHSRIVCLTVGKCTYGSVRDDIAISKPNALILVSQFIEKILIKTKSVSPITVPTQFVGDCGAKCRYVSFCDGHQKALGKGYNDVLKGYNHASSHSF